MSRTTSSYQCPHPTIQASFRKDIYQFRVRQVQESDTTNGLVAGLYGVLVVLSIQAIHALTTSRKTQLAAAIFLSLTVLALVASTTLYMVVTIMYNETFYLDNLVSSIVDFWGIDSFQGFNLQTSVEDLQKDYTWLYKQAGTATVVINIILGDAIVCWRACVVWGRNRVVRAVSALFMCATFLLGVLAATLGSRVLLNHAGNVVVSSGRRGALFEDNSIGLATCVLSLITNIVATLLIAYKAWTARRHLRGYLVAKAGGSQPGKLFAILIESGAGYCALWAIVVAYQISTYNYNQISVPGPGLEVLVLDIFGVIVNGALVPVIAIYPTSIIIIVASNESHLEKGLIRSVRTIPTSTHSGDASTTAHSRYQQARRSSVLLISQQHWDCEDGIDDANRGTHTREEWKPEPLI